LKKSKDLYFSFFRKKIKKKRNKELIFKIKERKNMPRPTTPRRILFQPETTYFKPAGIPLSGLDEIILSFEEIEALRLKDVNNLNQTKAAKEMEISQSTFFRVLSNARKKVSDAIVNGKAIRVQGGSYNFQRIRGNFGREFRSERK
jgi:uncharacterized protein